MLKLKDYIAVVIDRLFDERLTPIENKLDRIYNMLDRIVGDARNNETEHLFMQRKISQLEKKAKTAL